MTPQVIAFLKKVESDLTNDVVAGLIPALIEEANSFLPPADVAVATLIESAVQPALQQGLVALVTKIPSL